MDIHQVSVNYLQEHDRILVRINTRQGDEIRLWLTRRLCASWVPALRACLGQATAMAEAEAQAHPEPRPQSHSQPTDTAQPKPTPAEVPVWTEEFKHLKNLQHTEFKTPFNDTAKTLPLGTEPLLITTIRMTQQGAGKLDVAFEESLTGRTSQARGFQASLERQLLQGFMLLIDQALEGTQWGLPTPASDGHTALGRTADTVSNPHAAGWGIDSADGDAPPAARKYLH